MPKRKFGNHDLHITDEDRMSVGSTSDGNAVKLRLDGTWRIESLFPGTGKTKRSIVTLVRDGS